MQEDYWGVLLGPAPVGAGQGQRSRMGQREKVNPKAVVTKTSADAIVSLDARVVVEGVLLSVLSWAEKARAL